MHGFAGRYFYISPDEAARRVFGDAAAIFFGRDGMIAASRAPAAVLRPGSLISGCFASGRLPKVTVGAPVGMALSALGFDSGAFEALMLTSALLFRRVSQLRGFNLAAGGMGADAAGMTVPVLRLDALLDGCADSAFLPELAAMRRMAEAADVFFDTCSEPSADGARERLYVYFSPARIADTHDGLKSAQPAGGEEDAHAAAVRAFDGIPAGTVY